MTKAQTISTLAEKLGKSKKEATEMIDALVNLAYAETKKSGEFTVPGLGKLQKKQFCNYYLEIIIKTKTPHGVFVFLNSSGNKVRSSFHKVLTLLSIMLQCP